MDLRSGGDEEMQRRMAAVQVEIERLGRGFAIAKVDWRARASIVSLMVRNPLIRFPPPISAVWRRL